MIRQEDSEDQIELEADKDLAKSTAAVDSAKAALIGRTADLLSKQAEFKAKQLEYERVKKILDDGGGNNAETEKAKYEMDAAGAEIDAAKGMIDSAQADIKKAEADQGQAKYKAAHQQAHLEMMVLKAPTDAVVQSVNVEPGETVDPNSSKGGCITLVRIDIVQVEFFLPALQAQKLAKGQKLSVSYDQKEWEEATVQYVAPVASAPANGRETIHMDLLNPKMKAAGQVVFIKLPADIAAMRPDHVATDQ
jgi:multidrug resistance efflux pump